MIEQIRPFLRFLFVRREYREERAPPVALGNSH